MGARMNTSAFVSFCLLSRSEFAVPLCDLKGVITVGSK